MASTEYFSPGTRIFVVHENRVHAANVKSVTITVTADWQSRESIATSYGVALTSNPGKNIDVQAEDTDVTREGLLAKL
jgi:hypothetical protein